MFGCVAARSTRSTADSSSESDSASGAGRRSRRLRQIRARELIASLFAASFEHVDDFAHLLILEQPANELGARIFPLLFVVPRGSSSCALMRSSRAAISRYSAASFKSERANPHDELLADARDRDVVDVDLLFANQREQQIERAGKRRRLDDEPAAGRVDVYGVRASGA